MIGCSVVDPLLEVGSGPDYSLEIAERSLAFLKEIGHEATEFSHACHWTEEECAAVREVTERIGIVPWSLHAWATWDVLDDDGAEKTRQVLTTAVRNALLLGVGRIIHHPSRVTLGEAGARRRLEVEAELLTSVWQPGTRLALENGRSLDTMEYLLELVDMLGPGKAGVCVDTGHAALGDLGPGRALRLAGERLITTHLHDNHGEQDDHLPPGDGTIDWEDVVAALIEVSYPGTVMLELTDQPAGADRRLAIQDELRRGQRAAVRIAEGL